MNKKGKTQRGITLIALVITIIVMLILVGVTISMAVNGGLFEYAGKAVSQTNNALKAEQELSNGGIEVGNIVYNSIDEYLIASGNKKEESDPLAGTWEFHSGEETVWTDFPIGSFSLNLTYKGTEYNAVYFFYYLSGVLWFSLDDSATTIPYDISLTTTDSGSVSYWTSDATLTITDTYDESTHAELLTFLRANATKVN